MPAVPSHQIPINRAGHGISPEDKDTNPVARPCATKIIEHQGQRYVVPADYDEQEEDKNL